MALSVFYWQQPTNIDCHNHSLVLPVNFMEIMFVLLNTTIYPLRFIVFEYRWMKNTKYQLVLLF